MRMPGAKEANPLNILPASQFVETPLKKINGEIVWMNWDLLEQIAPETRLNNRTMSPELRQSILDRYCKVVDDEEDANEAVEKGYADKYRTLGSNDEEGSGRACHLATGENIKGVGRTKSAPRGVASHSDGCVGFEEAVIEAAAGEACAHLFDNKTTRVLAIIAPDKQWYKHPDQEAHPLLIIRIGNHIRPAHFVHGSGMRPTSADNRKLRNVMEKMFGETDSAAMEKRLAEGHASIAAKMRRWRLLHGSPGESNMGLGGSALDFGTVTAQPRTAPIFSLNNRNMYYAANMDIEYTNTHSFGAEHKAHQLIALNSLAEGEENAYWSGAFRKSKDTETFSALGLPENMSSSLVQQLPEETHTLAKHIRLLGRLFYQNMSADTRENWDEATRASFVDMHALLTKLPAMFFDQVTGEVKDVNKETILKALNINPPKDGNLPLFEDWRMNAPLKKYAVKDENEGIKRIKRSIERIQSLYPLVMQCAAEDGIQKGRWKNFNEFFCCVTARAEFENAPLEPLYSPVIRGKVRDAIKRYEEEKSDTARKALFEEMSGIIDQTVSGTKRRVDDLLYNSPVEQGDEPGSYRLQMQKIDDVLYYVEARKNGERNICMELPSDLLDDRQEQAKGKVLLIKQAAKPYQYGKMADKVDIDGVSIMPGTGNRQYTYAIPDDSELDEIIRRHESASEELMEPSVL